VQRVRGMEKFDSVEALIEEMGRDAEKARAPPRGGGRSLTGPGGW
ncbi:hypothetical protein GS937_27635, partial [Rhodococcus hoagii]|nr:hypothetical protein [Prescottella equi]